MLFCINFALVLYKITKKCTNYKLFFILCLKRLLNFQEVQTTAELIKEDTCNKL